MLTASGAAAANTIVPVDTTSGNVTVTLPTAPASGTVVAVKHIILGTGHTVTVACGGSDVLNKTGGGTSLSLTLQSQGVLLAYSSGIWVNLADDLPLSQLDARYAPAALTGSVPYVLNVRLGYGGGGANYSTDDTAAILAAITAAQAAASITGTMPVVYLPYGMWKITAAIPLPPSITFRGDGPRATYLRQFTTNIDTVQMLGTSGAQNSLVTIEGMTISGMGSGTGCGINMAWAENCTLRDVSVTNAGSHGIQASNCWNLNAYNVKAANNFGCGISAATSINNWSIIGGLFTGNALDGISINGGTALMVLNTDIEVNGNNGINFISTLGGTVSCCDFEQNSWGNTGTYSQITVGGSAYYSGPTILSNNFSGGATSKTGVEVTSPVNCCIIQGNEFQSHTVADILIDTGATNTALFANTYKLGGGSTSPATVSDSGTNTATIGVTAAAVSMESNLPTDYGWLAWNGDPDTAAVSASMGTIGAPVYTAGKAYHARINVRANITVGHIIVGWLNGTGTGLANSYLSLYNSSGTLVDHTADISGTTSGMISVALAGGTHLLNPGWYEIDIMVGTQNGTTPAGLMTFANAVTSMSSSFANMGITSGTAGVRWSAQGTGLTSWLSSITTHGASAAPFFCALAT